jgi:hypothetical protein
MDNFIEFLQYFSHPVAFCIDEGHDLYLVGTRFESQPGCRLSSLNFILGLYQNIKLAVA